MPAFTKDAKSSTAAAPDVLSEDGSPRCPPESCQQPLTIRDGTSLENLSGVETRGTSGRAGSFAANAFGTAKGPAVRSRGIAAAIAAAIAGIDAMTIYTFGAAQMLNPDADALAEASGGVYNYVGALAVSFSIFGVYLYQGIFAKK